MTRPNKYSPFAARDRERVRAKLDAGMPPMDILIEETMLGNPRAAEVTRTIFNRVKDAPPEDVLAQLMKLMHPEGMSGSVVNGSDPA